MIQGGEYEFAPFIRGEKKGDENFEAVAKLFEAWQKDRTQLISIYNPYRLTECPYT